MFFLSVVYRSVKWFPWQLSKYSRIQGTLCKGLYIWMSMRKNSDGTRNHIGLSHTCRTTRMVSLCLTLQLLLKECCDNSASTRLLHFLFTECSQTRMCVFSTAIPSVKASHLYHWWHFLYILFHFIISCHLTRSGGFYLWCVRYDVWLRSADVLVHTAHVFVLQIC